MRCGTEVLELESEAQVQPELVTTATSPSFLSFLNSEVFLFSFWELLVASENLPESSMSVTSAF